jgi:hypothetical protein
MMTLFTEMVPARFVPQLGYFRKPFFMRRSMSLGNNPDLVRPLGFFTFPLLSTGARKLSVDGQPDLGLHAGATVSIEQTTSHKPTPHPFLQRLLNKKPAIDLVITAIPFRLKPGKSGFCGWQGATFLKMR